MIHRISPRSWLALCVLFGGVTAYCFYGALNRHLFIPGRHGSGGAIYAGASSWLICGSMLGFWLITCINAFAPATISGRRKTALSLAIMIIAMGFLLASGFLPHQESVL